uniref:Low-density lipoprotein receptor domain class A n=1 Tax=Cyprinus carpio TaxID=7962 RepID=A0A8C2FHJ3_CYPCA
MTSLSLDNVLSSDPIPQTCHREHFKCSYLFECIPLSWHCDGEVDCLDSSDEERCVSVVSGTMPPQTGSAALRYGFRLPRWRRRIWMP